MATTWFMVRAHSVFEIVPAPLVSSLVNSALRRSLYSYRMRRIRSTEFFVTSAASCFCHLVIFAGSSSTQYWWRDTLLLLMTSSVSLSLVVDESRAYAPQLLSPS